MITVRVIYTDASEQREAVRLVKGLAQFLERQGYTVAVSRRYPNRKNDGGRYYIRVGKGGRS